MRYLLLCVILLITFSFCQGQIPVESEGYTITKKGFVYYTNENYLAFVAPIVTKSNLSYDDFFNDSLDVSYYLPATENFSQLYISNLSKCAKKIKLVIPWINRDTLTIIPVKISFTVHPYAYTQSQLNERKVLEKYKACDKTVEILSITLPVNVTSLESICN